MMTNPNPQVNYHQRNYHTQARTSHHQPFMEKKPHPSVRYSFNFIFIVIYFLRAIAHLNARAGSRGSRFTPGFFSTVRDGLAKARAPRPRAAHLSLCTPKNLVSRDGSGNTFSLPYMVLSTIGNYTSLEGTRTDPVQAIDQCRPGPTRAPARPQCQPLYPVPSTKAK